MRKISAMYQYSGGADYTHCCCECKNFIVCERGKKNVNKCKAYGVTEGPESDWKATYMACRQFNIPAQGEGLLYSLQREKGQKEMEGQMSLNDFW